MCRDESRGALKKRATFIFAPGSSTNTASSHGGVARHRPGFAERILRQGSREKARSHGCCRPSHGVLARYDAIDRADAGKTGAGRATSGAEGRSEAGATPAGAGTGQSRGFGFREGQRFRCQPPRRRDVSATRPARPPRSTRDRHGTSTSTHINPPPESSTTSACSPVRRRKASNCSSSEARATRR